MKGLGSISGWTTGKRSCGKPVSETQVIFENSSGG